MTIDPKDLSQPKRHAYLLSAVAPRPICFASTVDKEGNVNLSPYSFFNVFSSNPPIMVFSPARRGRDNTIKHTLENIQEVPEVVINIVNHAIVEQMSLSSTEYEKGVNEFIKSGLTPIESQIIKAPRVKESPASFECKVNEIIPLGNEGGAGNLVICEVVMMHFHDAVLNEQEHIDTHKMDLVSRMGDNWYSRANAQSIFEIPKPLSSKGIGVNQLPENIRNSHILTGNDLGRLGNIEKLPSSDECESIKRNVEAQEAIKKGHETTHTLARKWLKEKRTNDALALLMANRSL